MATGLKQGKDVEARINTNSFLKWDEEKNTIQPELLCTQSNKKIFLKCENGHSIGKYAYEVKVGKQIECPQYKTLGHLYPELAAEWDEEKNGGCTPDNTYPSSDGSAYWKKSFFKDGKEYVGKWHQSVKSRVKSFKKGNKDAADPFTQNKEAIPGYNDIRTLYPEVARYWDKDKNSGNPPVGKVARLTPGEFHWKCDVCHGKWKAETKWMTQYVKKQKDPNKTCPVCNHALLIPTVNSLAAENFDLASEWLHVEETSKKSTSDEGDSVFEKAGSFDNKNGDDLTPFTVLPNSSVRVRWRCKVCKHEWCATVDSRNKKGKTVGCAVCAGQEVKVGFNDLETTDKWLADQWSNDNNPKSVSPKTITKGCNTEYKWNCSNCGKVFSRSPNAMKSTLCKECSRLASLWENATAFFIAGAFPEIEILRGEEPFKGSHRNLDISFKYKKKSKVTIVGVEVDGDYYHELEDDESKDKLCEEAGVILFRLREESSPKLSTDSIVVKFAAAPKYRDGLDKGIKKLIKMIGKTLNWEVNDRYIETIDTENRMGEIQKLMGDEKRKDSVRKHFPYLIPWWDIEKNDGITPDNTSKASKLPIWWICRNTDKKHGGFQATIVTARNNFSKGGTVCPKCINPPLRETHPSVVEAWDDKNNGQMTVDDLTYGSNKVVNWKCPSCGISWHESVKKHALRNKCKNKNCTKVYENDISKKPEIKRRYIPKDGEDFKSTHPDLFQF